MADLLSIFFMRSSRRLPGYQESENPSPFALVFFARSVIKRLSISALFLILAAPFLTVLIFTLIDLNTPDELSKGPFGLVRDTGDAFILSQISAYVGLIFLLICLRFLIPGIQCYRDNFKNIPELMIYYRLVRSHTFSGEVIACPKCGNKIQMMGEIESGECQSCGFQLYPKSANHKIEKDSEEFSTYDLPNLLYTGRKLLDKEEYLNAFYAFKNVTDRFPEEHEGWWGLLCAKTEMFELIPMSPTFWTWYSKAYDLAPPKMQNIYKRTFETWSDARNAFEKKNRKK